MSCNTTIRQAVNLAVGAAAATAAGLAYAPLAFSATAAATGPSPDAGPSESALDEVVVTGSRVRRVDIETAAPVQVITAAEIAQSGITTVGDLVQRIPSISGSATTPNVNNGGGYGESCIELRGLDCKRTLILVDGRRIGFVGTTSDATDVNQIPFNMIERVEVLKQGAGAIYGSDAIGGVVNFITRKDLDGLEFGGDYGRTGKNDGQHHSVNLAFGTNTDKFSFMMGANLMKQDAVSAGNRSYSKYALYLYGASAGVTKGGSSRVPTGRVFANPTGIINPATGAPCTASGGLTRIAGASGAVADGANYRCYAGATDSYNYEPLNLLTTPVERLSFFSKANYKINDDLEAYSTVTQTHTHSGYHAAPLPFDSLSDNVVLSKDSIYNPFGIDFGGNSGANPDFSLRLTSVGPRLSDTASDGTNFNGGVKGSIPTINWTWDLNLTYSRLQQHAIYHGYYFGNLLQNAVGPSFIDPATGVATCGTALAPIAGCTPINFFNQDDPANAAALSSIEAKYNLDNVYTYKAAALDFNGKLFALPAGDVQAGVGFEYNDRRGVYAVDSLVEATPPLYLSCQISQEACTGSSTAQYNSKQEYLELFVPILKDLPGVSSLNVDLGVRHQDYSLFGSSTKADFKVEYRPIKDILIRGTFSQVLRVPTISDIAAAPAISSITFNDPCTNLTQAMVTANPNLGLACVGVPRDGTFKEPNGQITGLNESNPNLKPETGLVKTGGFVWDPSFVPGFTVSADYWSYHINGLITTLDSNYSIQQCVATGSPTFCNYAVRYGADTGSNAGLVEVFQNPSVNLGSLDESGVDVSLGYSLKNTPIGSFNATVDLSRINNYTSDPAPGAATQEIAGTYNRQFGNFAKLRGMLNIGWAGWGADGLVTMRYIGGLKIENPSVTGVTADGDPFPDLKIGSIIYVDASVGYTFATKTHVQAGIRNLADKQPPIFYLNNVTNANVDVNTYDTIGRQWFVGFQQKL
jgi:iron complex outermembrane recepter protein